MKDVLYDKIVKKWEETTDLPPQSVGPFTPLYKEFTKRLKVMPFPLLVFGALVAVVLLFLLVGSGISLVASILQRGF